MNEKNKIHVCHLVYSFDIGGLERVIVNCINILDHDIYKHSIIALTSVESFISEINPKIETYSLNKKSGHDISLHLKLYKLLNEIKPNVLHSYNLSTIEYQWIGAVLGISKRIHAEHGRDSYDIDGSVKKYQRLRKIMSRFINHFVMVSEDLYGWLKDEVSINQNKLTLIKNGIDTNYYHPNKKNRLFKRDYEHKVIFGHVARLHPIKNQEFLLESFEQACLSSPDFAANCVLIIVGDGPDQEKLANKVSISPMLSDKVIFTGSRTNVKDYYSVFDVFVMSSLAEGIPMTLLESMAMGIPHIVTSVGGIEEVVLKNITGFSLDEHDKSTYSSKMVELFENRTTRLQMAEQSRKRITESYSQIKMIADYDKIYRE